MNRLKYLSLIAALFVAVIASAQSTIIVGDSPGMPVPVLQKKVCSPCPCGITYGPHGCVSGVAAASAHFPGFSHSFVMALLSYLRIR